MKNRFIITVSDIHGVKQYTMHQFIKVFAVWVIVGTVIIFLIGTLLLYTLFGKVDELNGLTENLQTAKEQLERRKNDLETNILRKTEALESMSEQLEEIERLVGLEPDIESSFIERAKTAKNKTLQRIEKASLTAAQLAILNYSIPTGKPIVSDNITSAFGYRIHPLTNKNHFHAGIDFGASTGTPIYATADGVVELAEEKGAYGNYLLINHAFGFKTAFGHLNEFAVSEGDHVSKGDVIGYVGSSGRSTGPHLHYEIRYLHRWLNPDKFLKWSHKTYGDVMAGEQAVDWAKLMGQIEKRLRAGT